MVVGLRYSPPSRDRGKTVPRSDMARPVPLITHTGGEVPDESDERPLPGSRISRRTAWVGATAMTRSRPVMTRAWTGARAGATRRRGCARRAARTWDKCARHGPACRAAGRHGGRRARLQDHEPPGDRRPSGHRPDEIDAGSHPTPAPVREVPVEGRGACSERTIRQRPHAPARRGRRPRRGRCPDRPGRAAGGRRPGRGWARAARARPRRRRVPPGGTAALSGSKTNWTGGSPVASGPARQVSAPAP